MGQSVSHSKDRHGDETVDHGFLLPQGVYTGPQDWNQEIVSNLIVDRKLAPFYRPLEDYDESWDDERVLAARKELPGSHPASIAESTASSSNGGSKFHHHKQPNKSGKEPVRPNEAAVYKGAVECPICFLYYPSNINRSRCCDQAICTECFVQIKRAEPTTTHLVSEPASCPYCVQENFGVTYEPPSWRTGLVREGHISPNARPDIHKIPSGSSADSDGKRRKSFSADAPEVVTIDHIRPDWEAKLNAVRAAVARRANRRIIMRQVGDRLIPIGITSGRVVAAEGVEGAGEGVESGGGSSRRRRRHQQNADINQLLGTVGLGPLAGQDLEELMVMEAMRLSLLDHEEQQRRQSTEANNANGNGNNNTNTSAPTAASSGPGSTDSSPRPSISPPREVSPANANTSRSTFQPTPSPLGVPIPNTNEQPSQSQFSHPEFATPLSPTGGLAAALAEAQNASAFLDAQHGEERHVVHVEREPEHQHERGETTPRGNRATTPTPFEEPVAPSTSASSSVSEVTSTPDPVEESPSGSGNIPHPDPEADPEAETPAPVAEGYEPLPSSSELSDPLLSWQKGDEAMDASSLANAKGSHGHGLEETRDSTEDGVIEESRA